MSEAIQNDEFLTKRELARLCRCSERTIDRLLEGGNAPPVTRLSTRRIIFAAADARKWLLDRTLGLGRQPPRSAIAATPSQPIQLQKQKSPKHKGAREPVK